jgi:hypothetical protein
MTQEVGTTGAGALSLAAVHPNLSRVALIAAMVSCLLLVPGVLGLMRLTRDRAPWLGSVGGVLMIAGTAATSASSAATSW